MMCRAPWELERSPLRSGWMQPDGDLGAKIEERRLEKPVELWQGIVRRGLRDAKALSHPSTKRYVTQFKHMIYKHTIY